jgi:hypothetical protein
MLQLLAGEQNGIICAAFCGKMFSALNTTSGASERKAGGWTIATTYA